MKARSVGWHALKGRGQVIAKVCHALRLGLRPVPPRVVWWKAILALMAACWMSWSVAMAAAPSAAKADRRRGSSRPTSLRVPTSSGSTGRSRPPAAAGCRVVIPRVNVRGGQRARRLAARLGHPAAERHDAGTGQLPHQALRPLPRQLDAQRQLRPGDHRHPADAEHPHPRHRPRGARGRRSSAGHRRQRQDARRADLRHRRGRRRARARPATGGTSASCWPSSRTSASRTSPSRTRTAGRFRWNAAPTARCGTSTSPPADSR